MVDDGTEIRVEEMLTIVLASKITTRRRRKVDSLIKINYYLHGGILPYVLRQLLPGTTGF